MMIDDQIFDRAFEPLESRVRSAKNGADLDKLVEEFFRNCGSGIWELTGESVRELYRAAFALRAEPVWRAANP